MANKQVDLINNGRPDICVVSLCTHAQYSRSIVDSDQPVLRCACARGSLLSCKNKKVYVWMDLVILVDWSCACFFKRKPRFCSDSLRLTKRITTTGTQSFPAVRRAADSPTCTAVNKVVMQVSTHHTLPKSPSPPALLGYRHAL